MNTYTLERIFLFPLIDSEWHCSNSQVQKKKSESDFVMTDEALERKKAWYMGVMIQLREWYEIKLFHTGCGIDSFDVEAIEVLSAQKSDFEVYWC